jgi:hypothetical protein
MTIERRFREKLLTQTQDFYTGWWRECLRLKPMQPMTKAIRRDAVDLQPLGGGFFCATIALRDGTVRGVSGSSDEAILRARVLSGRKLY